MEITVKLPGDKCIVVFWKNFNIHTTFTADSFKQVYSIVLGAEVYELYLDGLLICKLPCDMVEKIFI